MIAIELNEHSAEDAALIAELRSYGLSEETIQCAYDETQRRRSEGNHD